MCRLGGKALFAIPCVRFVNPAHPVSRIVTSSPIRAFELRTHLSIGAVAIAVCVLTGPFGTIAAPWLERTIFWGAIIVLNMAKWQLWFSLIALHVPRLKRDFVLATAIGSLVLNSTLPLELNLVFSLLDAPAHLSWAPVYGTAVVISGLIGLVIALARPAANAPAAAGLLPINGIAARAGLPDFATVLAVEAEDHYCRLHLADGRRPLILYRFRDALAELAAVDGTQVHRGAWVAAGAVSSAERDGRKWRLRLTDGTAIPVSEGFTAEARGRGWLRVAAR